MFKIPRAIFAYGFDLGGKFFMQHNPAVYLSLPVLLVGDAAESFLLFTHAPSRIERSNAQPYSCTFQL